MEDKEMSRLKKDEFYVVAVNRGRATYYARKISYSDLEDGFKYAAVFPFCDVYEFNLKGQTLADVRRFCKDLERQGFSGTINTN